MKKAGVMLLMAGMLLVTLGAFLWLAYQASRGGEVAPLYSIRRFDPYGLAGLAKLLEHRGQEVISLQRPRLEDTHQGTLIQVLPIPKQTLFDLRLRHNPYQLPVDQLLAWISQGNTLIVLSRTSTPVMGKLGVSMAEITVEDDLSLAELEAQEARGEFPDQLEHHGYRVYTLPWQTGGEAGSQTIRLRNPGRFAQSEETAWRALAVDGQAVYACEVTHGQGKAVFIASPAMAINHYLADADNLEALLGLIDPARPVIFDEWAHGVGHAGSVMDVILRFGLLPLMAQVALGIFVYRWTTAGLQPRPVEEVARLRTSGEQIDTLGYLYDQTFDMPEKIRRVHDEVVHRFAKACRCDPSQVMDRLQLRQTRASIDATQLLGALRQVSATLRPVCRHCGYDLTSFSGDHCPECGKLLPRDVRRLVHRQDLLVQSQGTHRTSPRDLARILTQSHHLARELSVG